MDDRFRLIDRRLNRLLTGACKPKMVVMEEDYGHRWLEQTCSCGGHPECVTKPLPEVPEKSALELFTEGVYGPHDSIASSTPTVSWTLTLVLRRLSAIIRSGWHVIIRFCWPP